MRGETVPLSRFDEYYKELARNNNEGFRRQFEVGLALSYFSFVHRTELRPAPND